MKNTGVQQRGGRHPKNPAQSGRMYMYTGTNRPEREVKSKHTSQIAPQKRRTIRTHTNQRESAMRPSCDCTQCCYCCSHSRHSPAPQRTLLCWVLQTSCRQPRPSRRHPIKPPKTPA